MSGHTIQELALALWEDQKNSWPQLGRNRKDLESVRVRQFQIGGVLFRVQFNPRRIASSSARVDRESIEKRNCFLCPGNRPPEEKSVPFGEELEILCNPFPIFRTHFTIATRSHVPQEIDPWIARYLELSRALPDLAVFYNAPSCGASAPDHMHFQAGERGLMPIWEQLAELVRECGIPISGGEDLAVTAVDDGLRRFIVMESPDKGAVEKMCKAVSAWSRELRGGEEPMINMLACYRDRFQVLVFPRKRHRPWQYFEEGERNILLSPAAVDMGGTLITPLEKDFGKITSGDIADIFNQVCLGDDPFRALISCLKDQPV